VKKSNLPAQHNSTEIETPFVPTVHMLKWLETAIELGHTATITEVSKEAKVDRTTWYLWIKDPKFVDWWDNQWQTHLALNRWKLDAIGMSKAESNYDYWRDMMQRTGNLSSQQQGGNLTQVNVVVTRGNETRPAQ
jgi:hypothetical protein